MTTLQKKQKLRNAEYYDCQAMQDELYQSSCNGAEFKHLVELMASEQNIRLAYRNIKKNKGSHTAGVDDKTIEDLEKWPLDNLVKHVQKKLSFYVPQTIRRVEIPKLGSPKKKRPLGIPTIMDRLIQQCLLQVLEPICEAKFYKHSYGFRPNRSTKHAVAQAMTYMQRRNLHFVVDVDIKSFFDNVKHGKLLKQLWTIGIHDKKLLSIISAMLKAEVAEIGFPEKGTPQGGIISPLLSNVVLNELDWWVVSQWEGFPTKRQYKGSIAPNGTVSQNGKYQMLRKTSCLKECYIVRYADDFRVFCKTKKDAVRLFAAIKNWLIERLGLEISEEKSKIVDLKHNSTEFLGISLKLHEKGKKVNGEQKYTVTSHIAEKALQRIKEQTKRQIRKIKYPKGGANTEMAVGYYNAYVLGIHNYYSMATNVSGDLGKIAFLVKKNLANRINVSKDGKITNPLIAEKYGESSQMLFVRGEPLIPIGYIKHQSPMCIAKGINKYTKSGRASVHKNLETVDLLILMYLMRNPIRNRSIEYNDNRMARYCAQRGQCAVTHRVLEIDEIYCHHRKPLGMGGTDKYSNLIIVSQTIHLLIHAIQAETIKKLLAIENLTPTQLKKLNRLRIEAGRTEIDLG